MERFLITFILSAILTTHCAKAAPNGEDPTIVIIGAGISGLAAADRLINQYKFKNVTILEALDRVGGRIDPVPFGDNYIQMGAQWIHDRHNPIFDMALDLGLIPSRDVKPDEFYEKPLYRDQSGCPLPASERKLLKTYLGFSEEAIKQLEDWDYQKHPDQSGESYGQVMDELYQQFLKNNTFNESEVRFLDALQQNTKSQCEILNAAEDWNLISLRPANDEDSSEEDDDEGPISISLGKSGYKAILDEMTRRVPPQEHIQFNSRVDRIHWNNTSNGKVKIGLMDGRSMDADHVIVTSSLGHLKHYGQDLFDPKLPQKKMDTINALGFGTLEKLWLIYDKPYWPKKVTDFNFIRVNDTLSCNSSLDLPENYLTRMFEVGVPNATQPIVLFWISGRDPPVFTHSSESDVIDAARNVMRKFFNNINIPAPEIMRSYYCTNALFMGSYSYDSIDCEKIQCKRSTLMEPLSVIKNGISTPVVLFAGEATNLTQYATTHGAFGSGLREADRLAKFYSTTSGCPKCVAHFTVFILIINLLFN